MSAPALSSLRRALEATGFIAGCERLAAALGSRFAGFGLAGAAAHLVLEDRIAEPASALVALFAAGATVDRGRLETAAPELDIDALARLRLVRRDDDRVVPLVRIDGLEGMFVASDRKLTADDVVMGVSPATRTMAAYLPRRPAGVALDLGTGAGMLALLAAAQSTRVIATDVNARALSLAQINADLNAIRNVELRLGSLLEPVAGQQFDLVVANPPYVISPAPRYVYREGGWPRDELSRTILAAIPGILAPGGMATIQANWIHAPGEPWWRPVERILRGSGCDAFLVRLATETPLEYAMFWAAGDHPGRPEEFASSARRWRAGLDTAGVEAITTGMVVLRRQAEPTPTTKVAVTLDAVPSPRIGRRLPGLFAANRRLAALDDPALLATRLRQSADLTVTRRAGGAGGVETCIVEAPSALPIRRRVRPVVADAVLELDGERALGRVLPAGGGPLLADMRALAKLGFIEFA